MFLKEFLELGRIMISAESRFKGAAVCQVGKPVLDDSLQAIPLAFELFENFIGVRRE
jgi:hypothetical protein